MKFLYKHRSLFIVGSLLLLYFVTHLYGLLALPVFADEAIYIRWAQLIIDDWRQYLFFPLNDGKTPLFIWILIPFLKIFPDPLFAARVLSLIIGAIQLVILRRIVEKLGGKNLAQIFAMLSVIFLPFWVFFHRMGLIDSLLTLLLSTTVLGLIEIASLTNTKSVKRNVINKYAIFWIVFTGVSYGSAILTKLPAIFFLPAFPVFSQLFIERWSITKTEVWKRLIYFGIAMVIGLFLFVLLKLHPAFGQLFSRGQDFTFTIEELIQGQWRASVNNIGKILFWQGSYISFTFVALQFLASFFSKNKKTQQILFLAMLVFVLPFVIFGRVVSPRYLLPMMIFTSVSLGLFFEELYNDFKNLRLILFATCMPVLFIIARFFYGLWFDINALALVPIDREQYIEEWSAGQGIREMVDIIEQKAQTGRVVVATEGYFGTLPDGLLMYFHNRNVQNIEIFGIGQPIHKIPIRWFEKAQSAQTAYLLVNTYRMFVIDPCLQLVYKFPRPGLSSSLDVYELTKGCQPRDDVMENVIMN